MDLSPLIVYRKGVSAVPSVKYAIGVSAIVSAAMVAYNISHNDPGKAVFGFFFVLAGMYLLLVFAAFKPAKEVIAGPVVMTIWALSIMFLLALALTLSAYAFGKPERWAELVGAMPATARTNSGKSLGTDTTTRHDLEVNPTDASQSRPVQTTAQASSTPPENSAHPYEVPRDNAAKQLAVSSMTQGHTVESKGGIAAIASLSAHGETSDPMQTSKVAPTPHTTSPTDKFQPHSGVPLPKATVSTTFQFDDGSEDCGANVVKTVIYCLDANAAVTDWSGPTIFSANCGSAFENARKIPGRANCIAIDARIHGCGYDNFPFGIRNCKGRGWLVGKLKLNGEM